MLEVERTKNYALEFQACPTDCLPVSAAIVAAGEWGLDPKPLAAHLRRALRACENGGAGMTAAAMALRDIGIPAFAMHGFDLRVLAQERHHDGGVVLGVRPSILYNVPDGPVGHAMVMASASQPVVPGDWSRAYFNDFVAPVGLVDPHPGAPTRRLVVSEVVRWAYDAHGRWALWVPTPRTAWARGWVR
jgi:hypothetical protein